MNTRMLNGYRMLYRPEHKTCMKTENWSGYVYEHIYIVENELGRSLEIDEVVHHLDGNRNNNRKENLLLLSRGMHTRLHKWIEAGSDYSEGITGQSNINTCEICDITLQEKQKRYCSVECLEKGNDKKTKRPSKEILENDINNMSWIAIGKKYGVSDNAARKWAKKYGII